MMTRDQREKLSTASVVLHWLVAITIIMLLASGKFLHTYEDFSGAKELRNLHKSVGITIFVLLLIRVWWRLKNGWPIPLGNSMGWQVKISRIVHHILLWSVLFMPISGALRGIFAGKGLRWFDVQLMEKSAKPLSEVMADIAHEAHETLGMVIIVVLVLHILGALKHALIDRDGTLSRMLGKRIK